MISFDGKRAHAMGSLIVGLLKLLWPAIKEWWRSKKLSPKSDKALREINQIFAMQILLLALFFVSIEHGISIYAHHTGKQREYSYERRAAEQQVAHFAEVKQENDYLKGQYTRVIKALEYYAKEDSWVVLQRLEEAGVLKPLQKNPPDEPKPR